MVTAPAPALPDSHALPPAAVGAASNSSTSPNSFQSVYQSLPVQSGSSQDRSDSQSSAKTVPGKRTSPKGADNNLAAIVSPATIDPSSTLPLLPAHPSFSLTARDRGSASEPSTKEAAQFPTSGQEVADAKSALQNRIKYVATADAQASARTIVGSALEADVKSPVKDSLQARTKSSLQAGVDSGGESDLQFAKQLSAANPLDTATIARREPVLSSQGASSAPSFSIGAPALPAISEISLADSPELANPSRSTRTATGNSSQPSVDPALFTKGLAAALAPRQDNLAFSLKMAESNSTARHAEQATQSETADRTGTSPQAKSQEHAPAITLSASARHASVAPPSTTAEVAAVASTVSPAWTVANTAPHLDIRPDTQFTEAREPANLSTVAAMHEAQQILPETPRPTAAAEIMLQLGSKDQAAAIRVTDRAGTVNVSVHAADADVRSTLRSNLGDLASQLSHQGWKTEVVKTGAALARGETSQDPQQGGQRSPNQQQPSSQGDRQPQRERRSNSGQWLAEFEEQASGNSGGKN